MNTTARSYEERHPALAPGNAFHIGDIVRNKQDGYDQDLTVTERGSWESRYYRLVHCPHELPSATADLSGVDWESIAVRVALADGAFYLLNDTERDALETAIDNHDTPC